MQGEQERTASGKRCLFLPVHILGSFVQLLPSPYYCITSLTLKWKEANFKSQENSSYGFTERILHKMEWMSNKFASFENWTQGAIIAFRAKCIKKSQIRWLVFDIHLHLSVWVRLLPSPMQPTWIVAFGLSIISQASYIDSHNMMRLGISLVIWWLRLWAPNQEAWFDPWSRN